VGAVGIVKLSGRDSIEIASKVCKLRSGKKIQKLPSFKLTLCDIIDDNNKALDEGLVVLMREPYSYTRENVVEIQVHSSTLIIQKIIQICIIKGARLAEPGEFTKRAFLNGRISLNQAAKITFPAAVATIFLPAGAAISTPVCQALRPVKGSFLQP
jgi:tRNA modification GTPase